MRRFERAAFRMKQLATPEKRKIERFFLLTANRIVPEQGFISIPGKDRLSFNGSFNIIASQAASFDELVNFVLRV